MKKKEMEASSGQSPRRKGGFITMPFIIGNEAFAKVALTGLVPNLVFYMMGYYSIRLAEATHILVLWFAASNFAPLIGAFVADSFLGRFLSVALGSIIVFLGTTFLWLTAMIPELRPTQSTTASPFQMAFFIIALSLISIGVGGISCSLPFGADQLNKKSNPNNHRVLESFISWYYASQAFAVVVALTGVVYAQDHLGWKLGFGIPAALMFLSIVLFFLASPLYVKNKPHSSLLTGLAQVIVVAYKNRHLSLPPDYSPANFHHRKGSDLLVPTHKLRFLNKACIIKNPERDITPEGSASNPWNLSTTDQVEELKALIKVLPLWSSSIMMSVSTSQTSFRVLQAKSMNRHIFTHNFQIPPGSFSTFMIVALFLTIFIYDRLLLPLASRIAKKPVRIAAKTRIGIGLFFLVLDFVASAIIENRRRNKAISEGLAGNPNGEVDMSAMWLLVHHALLGIGEAMNSIGQSELYYSEFPRTMSSIGSSLYNVGMAVGNVVASVIVSVVDRVSSRGGRRESWISDDLNRGHYDWYFWVLAAISALNFGYYLICSWAYGSTETTGFLEEEEEDYEEDYEEDEQKEEEEKEVGEIMKPH